MAALVAIVSGTLLSALPALGAFAPAAEGTRVAVATDSGDATRAALATLAAGGSAADGAVSAALTLGVVNPVSSGLGGGGFALVYTARDHKVTAIDFREIAPAHIVADDIVQRSLGRGGVENAAKRGVAVGVPGEPAGLERLVRVYGKRSLADDAAPAAFLAEHGFLVTRYMGEMATMMQERLGMSPELSGLLLPGGAPLAYRTRVTRPELARSLVTLGSEGSKPFYEGAIAARIVRAVQDAGGPLEASDLAAYKVREREPLTRIVDGRSISTMPAPSAGGLMLLEVASMLGAGPSSSLRAMGFGSGAYLHTVAEAMRGAVADRVRFAGDPDADPGVAAAYERALDAEQLASRKARIDPRRVHRSPEFRTREHGTTHIVVADADGNVVSLTTSVNAPFGARIVAGGTGIVLNDQLDDFSTPDDLKGFGVIGLGPNRARAAVRPVSSMAPTIVLENGLPILAIGGSGGQRIATGIVQATLARLVFGLDPAACVSAPRIHVNGASDVLLLDADMNEDIRAALRTHGETLKDDPWSRSSMNMIAWDRSGPLPRVFAASDPRKEGMSAAQ